MSVVREAMHGIWERRFYTNNGPLVRDLDAAFAARVGSAHAIAIVNAFLGIAIALRAFERRGEVIVPALGAARTADAIRWAGAVPVFADVDADGGLEPADVRRCTGANTIGVAAVHLDGMPCAALALEEAARAANAFVIFDAREAVDGSIDGRAVGTFGDAEVLAFSGLHSEAGCVVTTGNDVLAARMRTMRSFHAGEVFAPVAIRANGKMSEAQAVLAPIAGDDVDDRDVRVAVVAAAIDGIAGVATLAPPTGRAAGSAAPVVLSIDPDAFPGGAPVLAERLRASGIAAHAYGAPPPGFPAAAHAALRRLRLEPQHLAPASLAALTRELRRTQR
jgi:dTDP-4-amino-4,6-dideoxyglucose